MLLFDLDVRFASAEALAVLFLTECGQCIDSCYPPFAFFFGGRCSKGEERLDGLDSFRENILGCLKVLLFGNR